MVTQPEPPDLLTENARLKRKLERERMIRLEAEAIAEKGLRDLYERQRELQTLEAIATKANQSTSMPEVLQFCIDEICQFHGWKVGHAYIVDKTRKGPVLRSTKLWYMLEPEKIAEFRAISENSEFEYGTGLPGRVLQSRTPAWISDILADENFPRLKRGSMCGLRCAVAFPVLAGHEVIGILEFFDYDVRAPQTAIMDVMRQIGTQMGRVIERQQAEDALLAHSKELAEARDIAEAADRAKSAFLANMSHELRTPLNAIIGFSEIMQHEIAGPLHPKYKEYAGDIERSGTHLKNIINDILDLSKIAVDALELREEKIPVGNLVDACRNIIQPLAENGEITLGVEIADDVSMIMADETRLKQAMLNILSNAVKFTPTGGSVTMRAMRDASGLCISVTDTGIGMSPADVKIALQPFRQIDSALSRRYEGTGLGLPLAKAFVELHGGTLSIESALNHGTTAVIHLPAARMSQAA